QRSEVQGEFKWGALFPPEHPLARGGQAVDGLVPQRRFRLLAERFGLADLGLQPRALTRTLNEAVRLTLEPVVRMPAEIDRVWRHSQALTDMGYMDAACAFYGKARERFARARTTLDARMRQLACGPL
ncbi:MAG: hypothetical protein CME20_22605, partial [Gemmatimonadetes bacterium]|nr:hypothetical protein [Gemmatimonadota bacterium]